MIGLVLAKCQKKKVFFFKWYFLWEFCTVRDTEAQSQDRYIIVLVGNSYMCTLQYTYRSFPLSVSQTVKNPHDFLLFWSAFGYYWNQSHVGLHHCIIKLNFLAFLSHHFQFFERKTSVIIFFLFTYFCQKILWQIKFSHDMPCFLWS